MWYMSNIHLMVCARAAGARAQPVAASTEGRYSPREAAGAGAAGRMRMQILRMRQQARRS
jgi:hypothetical protein